MGERLEWNAADTGLGWKRHEGRSENCGPYVIEKEDTRSFSIWLGSVEIGEADSVAAAKSHAQKHSDGLCRGESREGE